MTLKQSFSTPTLFASAVTGIIGSGWLLGPMACAKIAGPSSILCWIIAGLLMMVVATPFVILARSTPITGGTVRFFQITYGPFAGFSFAWIAWLAWIAVTPIETMALVQYSANSFPSLMTQHGVLSMTGIIASMLLMTLITFVNCAGAQSFKCANHLVLAFKLVIPLSTAFILIISHGHFSSIYTHGGFTPYGLKSIVTALPLAGVIYSFIGFNPVIQLAGEARDPKKAIPVAIFGSLAVCIIIYTIVQIAFVCALPDNSLKNGWASMRFAGQHAPFIGLLSGFGFVYFIKVVFLDSIISPFGSAMVQSMSTSRLTYAMSENGFFAKAFLKTNKNAMPKNAMIFNLLIGFLFLLPFPSWQKMVGFLVSCLVVGYIVGPISLMAMIYQNPKSIIPFSKKMIHGICISAFIICNCLIYWSGWQVVLKVMILFLMGYALLFYSRCKNKKDTNFEALNIKQGSWTVFYIIGLSIISALGSFGGSHTIAFGIDFFVIVAFSIVIYYFAFCCVVNSSRGKHKIKHAPLIHFNPQR